MVMEIHMPNTGEDELEVTEILIKIGDKITVNQPLIVIEGDKSSMEVPAPYCGIVTNIHVHIGDKINTGSLIVSLDDKTTHDNCTYIKLTNDKKSILQNIDNTPSVNILKNENTLYNITHHENTNHHHTQSSTDHDIIQHHATPLIRHMAREFKIDLSKVKGTGRKGRILKEDIENYVNNLTLTHNNNDLIITPTQKPAISNSKPEIDFSRFGNITTIELNKIKKISGTHLKNSWTMIPHVTQFDTIDITDLEIFRKQQNIEIEEKKINCKITILSFIIKAIAKILQEFPNFNSSLSQDEHTLILKKYINIGIAVDTKQGLLVPVLRDVNKKGIIKLSQELLEISQKARCKNQLTPYDIQGGSFTISNLGGIGGTAFTPIINSPEVAILGISKSSIHPIWTGKKFIPRLMLPISLSYDHRVIDGADGARFINRINKIISDIRHLSM